MATPTPTPTSVSLPLPVPLLDDAYIDALPLELKLRICSFLTPKDLKPLRLTSKIFAAAGGCYLIRRFILFNCQESVAALSQITDHEVFSKNITTLVCDISFLAVSPSCQKYESPIALPTWDDYRPKTLELDDKESYGTLTKGVMQRAYDKYQTDCKYWEAKKRDHELLHDRYTALMRNQKSDTRHLEIAATIREAMKKCPRLRNLILSNHHSFFTKRRRHDVLGIEVRDPNNTNNTCDWSMRLVQALGHLSQLSSLTLIGTGIEGFAESLTLPNLKHFRINWLSHRQFSKELEWNCALILRGAKSLETLSLGLPEHDITDIVRSLRSDRLRVCLLRFHKVVGTTLVDALLRHAPTLQRLGFSNGSASDGWLPVFRGIAGRLPAILRVQLQCLKENSYTNMSPGSAREAARFVVLGGSIPVLQYKKNYGGSDFWPESDQDIEVESQKQDEPSSGVWQDYESMAVEGWDGYAKRTRA